MSFFRKATRNKQSYKKERQTCNLRANMISNTKLLFKIAGKRMSFCFSHSAKASMAVEASLAIPIFLFFFMNILTAFDVLRLHGNLTAAMQQTGNKMAVYGYALKEMQSGHEVDIQTAGSVILSEGYVKTKVVDYLGEDYLSRTCLASGTSGLHFIKSSIMKENDVIKLIASYKIKPLIGMIGFRSFPMENIYYARAWTGYDAAGGSGEWQTDPYVYITETGVVYHDARSCTYLNPSIRVIAEAALDSTRNEGGGKYHACERCGEHGLHAIVYITAQGDRFHGSLNCPGLKRTVYTVRLSQTNGKAKCSKCNR